MTSSNCDLRIPNKNLSAADPRFTKLLEENWRKLEEWVRYQNRNCGCEMSEVQFTFVNTLTTDESGAWQSDRKRRATGARLTMNGYADTSDISITVYRNGESIGVLTLPAGENWTTTTFSPAANFGPNGEFLSIAATDIGDLVASKFTVIVYFACGGEDGAPPDPTPVPEV